MAQTVPLIRTAALVPWVHWLERNGRPAQQMLADSGLSFIDLGRPDVPVPMLLLPVFMRRMADGEGGDIGCRVVTDTSLRDLANLGLVALSSGTVGDAFAMVAKYMPRHSSHEVIAVEACTGGLSVSEFWHVGFDDLTLHLIHQYVASLLYLVCRLASGEPMPPASWRMAPHPQHGLDHLRPWLGPDLSPAEDAKVTLTIPARLAAMRLPKVDLKPHDRVAIDLDWTKLRENGVLSASVEVIIEAMLPSVEVSAERLALCAGMSTRTLQRRLEDEGTSVSDLIDATRRKLALHALRAGEQSLSELAGRLGYRNLSALTRAVRRWTGESPSVFRAAMHTHRASAAQYPRAERS